MLVESLLGSSFIITSFAFAFATLMLPKMLLKVIASAEMSPY
jgi:hypothetical protein